jgi:transcriptional regulator with XRE-family HTH domain
MNKPAKRLEYLRRVNFYSQSDVAKELGISQSAYFKIEHGVSRLTVDHAVKLRNLYKVSHIDDLLEEVS